MPCCAYWAVFFACNSCNGSGIVPVRYSGSGSWIDPDGGVDALSFDGSVLYTEDRQYERLVGTMNSLMRDIRKYPDVKGTLLLACDDKIIFVGSADEFEADGVTRVGPYTTYEINRVTRTFTAAAVLQLAEDGKLGLDDTLGKYFPEYGLDADTAGITVGQLLHMTSGLYDYTGEPEEVFGHTDSELAQRVLEDKLTDRELLTFIFGRGLKHEPGLYTEQNGTDYHLLAIIIEKVSGMSWKDYIQKNIFDVCGMEHSSCVSTGDLTSVPSNTEYGGYTGTQLFGRGTEDIHSCAADLAAFDSALLSGRLISDRSFDEMFGFEHGCGGGWFHPFELSEAYENSGATHAYTAVNTIFGTEKHGNFYLIQLYSSYNDNTLEQIKKAKTFVYAALNWYYR